MPRWVAMWPSAIARWVLPTPEGPSSTTLWGHARALARPASFWTCWRGTPAAKAGPPRARSGPDPGPIRARSGVEGLERLDRGEARDARGPLPRSDAPRLDLHAQHLLEDVAERALPGDGGLGGGGPGGGRGLQAQLGTQLGDAGVPKLAHEPAPA